MTKADIEKIWNATVLNNGSSSVKGDGYKTLRNYTGYLVGGFSHCIKVSGDFEAFSKALNNLDKMLERGDILGTWVHNDTIYIEQSKLIENLDFALAIAKLNEQLAIYDIQKQNDIKVI